jgi:hypothetical protein
VNPALRNDGTLPGLPTPAKPHLVASVQMLFTVTGTQIEMHPQVWVPDAAKRIVAGLLQEFEQKLLESERRIVTPDG